MFDGLTWSLVLMLLAMGLTSGFLAGLLGVGGGMVLVPFLVYILGRQGVSGDVVVQMAVASAMATILFTSMSSILAHQRRGAIRWDIVRGLVPGILLGGLISGAGIFSVIKGQALGLFFAAFVGWSAWRMFRGGKRATADKPLHGRLGLALVGSGIGMLSGLVGAGGGFLSVPYMTNRRVAIHNAVATSAVLGFPIAVANVVGYAVSGYAVAPAAPHSWGFFYLPAVILIALCSVTTAPLGARLAHRLDVAALKRVFAVLLAVLAAYMFYKSLA